MVNNFKGYFWRIMYRPTGSGEDVRLDMPDPSTWNAFPNYLETSRSFVNHLHSVYVSTPSQTFLLLFLQQRTKRSRQVDTLLDESVATYRQRHVRVGVMQTTKNIFSLAVVQFKCSLSSLSVITCDSASV